MFRKYSCSCFHTIVHSCFQFFTFGADASDEGPCQVRRNRDVGRTSPVPGSLSHVLLGCLFPERLSCHSSCMPGSNMVAPIRFYRLAHDLPSLLFISPIWCLSHATSSMAFLSSSSSYFSPSPDALIPFLLGYLYPFSPHALPT